MTKQEIYPLFKGICRIEDMNDGYIFPARMTRKQEEYFVNDGPGMGMRAKCTPGVRLDFYTDAKVISLSYRFGEAYRKTVSFDLYINDVLCDSHRNDGSDEGKIVWELEKYDMYPETYEERRVTIHFPCIAQTFIKDVKIGNARPAESPKEKILFFGDSITQGVDCGVHASLNYVNLASRYLNAEYMNLGVGSARFCPGFIDNELAFKPDEIVVAYGSNDCVLVYSEEGVRRDIPEFFRILTETYPGVPLYVITPIWNWRFDDNGTSPYSEAEKERISIVLDLIKDSCEKTGANLIDGRKLICHIPDLFRNNDPHPVEAGFAIYGAELAKAISELRNTK